jgi:hypothetical protein
MTLYYADIQVPNPVVTQVYLLSLQTESYDIM